MARKRHWKVERDGDLAQVIIDTPDLPVNVLSLESLDDLERSLAALRKKLPAVAVFSSGKPGMFLAGADVDEIASVESESEAKKFSKRGQAVLQQIADLRCTTVAAINGMCLGGGTELALACDYRIMTDDEEAVIGLPEIQLGIIPGFGGSTRLPRLLGIQDALEMMLKGSRWSGRRARKAGLIDVLTGHRGFDNAVRDICLAWRRKESLPRREGGGVVDYMLEDTAPGRALLFQQVEKRIRGQVAHYPAAGHLVKVVKESVGESIKKALDIEATEVAKLAGSSTAESLIRLFKLSEEARKAGRKYDGTIRKVVVLGAGVMGGGISQLLAHSKIPVRMRDLTPEALQSGLRAARANYRGILKSKRYSAREVDRRLDYISPTLELTGVSDADLVIEAVVEKMKVKQSVLADIESRVGKDCVLATNTSSLPITEMASALKQPGRFVGIHFFNPVHRMRLVEVIPGKKTTKKTLGRAIAMVNRLGKVPVVVKDVPGFLVNRILLFYLMEAVVLMESGVSIAEIDRALLDFGMPMGPFELLDEVGLDVASKVGVVLRNAYGERVVNSDLLARMVEAGFLGRKSRAGFYTHKGKGEKEVRRAVYRQVSAWSERKVSRHEIVDRLVLVMVAEAARCLKEKVVASPEMLDLAMVLGTGFAPFRGGLWKYAVDRGLDDVASVLSGLEERYGARFQSEAPSS